MKAEKLLNVIGSLSDDLILEAEKMDEKPKKHKVRWNVLAACLCLLIAIPVAAANKELLVELLSDESGWRVQSEHRFTLRDFSNEVRKLGKEAASGETLYQPMESVEDAEAFLGVEIPDNSILTTRAIPDELHMEVTIDGQKVRYDEHCLVMLHYLENGKLGVADTQVQYRYGTAVVELYYRMPTTAIPYENGAGIGVLGEENFVEQTYTTPSGREFAVFYADGILHSGYGYGIIDGVLVQLYVSDRSEENLHKWMTRLLDGFE